MEKNRIKGNRIAENGAFQNSDHENKANWKNADRFKTNRAKKAIFALFAAGALAMPTTYSQAAVITSNATDKIAVLFDENTAYSAGDYTLYDGELYICVHDIQGTWEQAQEHFLQVTKNRELGKGEELSAEYQDKKDPSEEKSLLSFVANAWQKLKGFFGIGSQTDTTDKENYPRANVSAKLNYLKTQNEGLETQNETLEGQNDELKGKFDALQKKVNDSFTSVSSGKSLLAGAITDKGVSVSSSATFEQLRSSILTLCQKEREEGKQAGITEADGHVNPDSESYKAGMEAADKRENDKSISYIKGFEEGKKQGKTKPFESDIELSCNNGPKGDLQDEEEFTSFYETSYAKHWNYTCTLPEQTKVRYAYVQDNIQEGGGYASSTKTAILVNDNYVINHNGNDTALGKITIKDNVVKINGYVFNPTYANNSGAQIHIHIFYE